MKAKVKKETTRRGRPPLVDGGGESGRFMVHLPVKVATMMKALGAGSLSLGVIRLADKHQGLEITAGPPPLSAARQKALARSRARAQKALDVVNKMLNTPEAT